MLVSTAEYFEKIFNLQMAAGSLTKKQEHQIELGANCDLR